jgi:hypothetical protein
MRRSSADAVSASGLHATAARSVCENSRPIAAPICATSLPEPSRSSRAIREACKLAGTASTGDGIAATARSDAPSPSASSTALVISSVSPDDMKIVAVVPATAAEQRNGTEGSHTAAGVNVQLNAQQRTEIRTTVINAHGAPRVSHVDFDVTVGTVVPRERIHVVPVPETLVRIEPEWRGFLYFVYEDEVVIVSPDDMKIVAVVPA